MTKSEREGPASLLEQLRQSYKTDRTETFSAGEDTPPGMKLPDGYVRRSPVQTYREGPDYHKKQLIRTAILCVVAAAVIVIVIILCNKIFHFSPFKLLKR